MSVTSNRATLTDTSTGTSAVYTIDAAAEQFADGTWEADVIFDETSGDASIVFQVRYTDDDNTVNFAINRQARS